MASSRNTDLNMGLKITIVSGIFTLLGAVVSGVFFNWDKIFGPPVVQEPIVGYEPTGEFDTEARYLMELSGTREIFEITANDGKQKLEKSVDTLRENPAFPEEDIEILDRLLGIVQEEQMTHDQLIAAILPVYREHYTVEEIQKFNKFLSTPPMRTMASKTKAVWSGLLPELHRLNRERIRSVSERIRREFPSSSRMRDFVVGLLESIANQE